MTDNLGHLAQRNNELAAAAIIVFVAILKETNVPLRLIIRALREAWRS